MLSSLRKYDAYAKTLDDFRIRTKAGGIVTLVSSLFIALLVISEWNAYRTPELKPSLLVDTGRKDKMNIYLNITFPKIPLLSLDVMDVSGEHQNELSHDIYKVRLDKDGRLVPESKEKTTIGDTMKAGDKQDNSTGIEKPYCGSCYGANPPASGCCNTCQDVQDAYRRVGWTFKDADTMEQARCNVHGHITVNKVAGNFHFAPGKSFEQSHMHVHDMFAMMTRQFDFTHTIHYLSFGEVVHNMVNPMDGLTVRIETGRSHLIQNFIKVVGTRFYFLDGKVTDTNQFSVTEYSRDVSVNGVGHTALPGVFFNYDISPMLVVYRQEKKSFSSFITSLCAIVGGVFTVASLVDAALYRTGRVLQKKAELGKLS
ncbi:ER-derived vesicles protein erv46 [Sorochytrium milnesiophthora]